MWLNSSTLCRADSCKLHFLQISGGKHAKGITHLTTKMNFWLTSKYPKYHCNGPLSGVRMSGIDLKYFAMSIVDLRIWMLSVRFIVMSREIQNLKLTLKILQNIWGQHPTVWSPFMGPSFEIAINEWSCGLMCWVWFSWKGFCFRQILIENATDSKSSTQWDPKQLKAKPLLLTAKQGR